ncbi:MAG: nucleotidyltransferase domain-containing protein [Blastocatellia bacterium]|jgi:predicted nucleotidyltransferase|nr:nucleotidyltransferase domain-containing protein [Blastocatellia bacterium]MBK6424746.1 nucleotidyltransferase domain-containing protein [Blastocatellia bacterium]
MSRNAAALDAPWLASLVSDLGPALPLFAVVSGAHLYGFPSSESDVDIRGAHVLPLESVISLRPPRESHDRDDTVDGMRIDLLSHDIGKYLRLLVAKNGYVLEQITSPHVVVARPEFEQLRSLAHGFVNRTLYHHYRGFVRGRWKAFTSEEPKRVKTLLYVYRVLLTGIHLMSTGEVECNVTRLAADRNVDGIADLIERKRSGDGTTMGRDEVERHAQKISMLEAEMLRAYERSSLPDAAPNIAEIDRFLIDVRMAACG